MARRRRNEEVTFGSDSFLDIVANIVGILIILIVIAGVRVSQMPAVTVPAAVALAESVTVPPVLVVDVPEVVAAPTPPAPSATTAPADPMVPPPPILPDPDLVARMEATAQSLEQLNNKKAEVAEKLLSAKASLRTARDMLSSSQSAVMADRARLEEGRQTVASLESAVEGHQREIAGLHLQLAEIESARPEAKVLHHKLTPLGKTVEGEELHFLLSKNQVAVVPVEELAEKLKEEIQRKKTQLLRGQTRMGSVGPVKGFTMEYVIEREALSLREELQMGTAVIRLVVSEWRLLPQPDVRFESADEALLPRSRFLEALRGGGSAATLTFWVYPDSFGLHRQLQDFGHDNGFTVAGRPLPIGIPITGSSTKGSRSIAQ